MKIVTITKNEYYRLLSSNIKRDKAGKKNFAPAAFGVLKDKIGKSSSVGVVNKIRKSWRV